jgi:hypothetical protein
MSSPPKSKTFIILSPPRSASTILFRYLYEFVPGPKKCFHEPACPAHGYKFAEADWKTFVHPDHYEPNYDPVHQRIMTSLRENPLTIIKDMAVPFKDFALPHLDAMTTASQVYGVFLVRDPRESLYSHYLKCERHITPGLRQFLGFNETYELIQEFQRRGIPTLVVRSEDFVRDPASILERISTLLGVRIPIELTWQPLPQDFDYYTEWHECKQRPYVERWHGDACRSTGFRPPQSRLNKDVDPRYGELYQEFLDTMMDVYVKIVPGLLTV